MFNKELTRTQFVGRLAYFRKKQSTAGIKYQRKNSKKQDNETVKQKTPRLSKVTTEELVAEIKRRGYNLTMSL